MKTSENVVVQVEVLPHGEGLSLPEYVSPGSAGMDLRAAVAESVTIGPGQRQLVPTGLRLAIPDGYEGQVRPRSGLALEYGLTLLNSPGTIDSDYRGEVRVIIANLGDRPFTIARGDRIAQMVIAPIARAEFRQVRRLADTQRSSGGFGHTGRQ
ncbi:MAG: dUTP diphosphatase [Armatimonadota bacterium]